MQRYQCHKVVEAAKIMSLCGNGNGTTTFEFEAPVAPVTVDTVFMNRTRIRLNDMGYFVRYADGYTSWSPTKAFEDGYKALIDKQVTVDVHRHPGHEMHLFFTADEPYERVRRLVRERVEDFLRRAFFGVDGDGTVRLPEGIDTVVEPDGTVVGAPVPDLSHVRGD